jgi:hypothetical protein
MSIRRFFCVWVMKFNMNSMSPEVTNSRTCLSSVIAMSNKNLFFRRFSIFIIFYFSGVSIE